MTQPTFDEFRVGARERAKEQAPARAQHLRMLHQAAVNMDMLTGDAAWDQYLSFVAAAVEQLTHVRDNFRARMESPATVSHEDMLAAKFGFREAEAQIAALTAAMELPKAIRADGVAARSLLDRMEPGAA